MILKEAIRDVLGVREVIGSDEWPSTCFSPEHNDARPSASVNVAKGVWTCYSCGRGGSVADLLSGVRISDPSADDLLHDVDVDLAGLESRSAVQTHPESWLSLYDYWDAHGTLHPYWASRGYTAVQAARYRLGYDYECHRATYPIRDYLGRVLGVVRRATTEMMRPKYLYPKGVTKSHHLFGYYEMSQSPYVDLRTLVLVEGALDAIALWEQGICAMGTYGNRLSEQQEKLIRRFHVNDVVVAYDMDEGGETGRQHILYGTTLANYVSVRAAMWDPIMGKDIDELDPAYRAHVIAEADTLW